MKNGTLLRSFPGSARRERGMSLIETMVALAIGMLMTLIIYQLYATFEAQKRTTGSGGSAQTGGILSLLSMERDIRMASWGMNNPALLNCTNIYSLTTGAASTPALTISSLVPVSIEDRGDGPGRSDRIVVRLGSSIAGAAPVIVGTVMDNPAAELRFSSAAAFQEKDVVIVASERVDRGTTVTDCTVGEVTKVDPAWGKIERSPGGTLNINPSVSERGRWPSEREGAKAFSLGGFFERIYEIDQGNLVLTENGTATRIGNHIVGIKAEYGISDGGGTQEVRAWVRATASGGVDWSRPGPADVARIKAVRLAVLSRSVQRENQRDAQGNCNATDAPIPAWRNFGTGNTSRWFDASDNPDWRCYRYRVYETIIPLRNVLWAKV